MPDLRFLAAKGFPCAFFCANDYADLRGEVGVHAALLGSKFVLGPRKNPFSMMTHYTGEAGESDKEWFCGNSFVYVTCGCRAERLCSMPSEEDGKERARMVADVLAKSKAFAEGALEVEGVDEPPLMRLPAFAPGPRGGKEAGEHTGGRGSNYA